ncbi:uncharacterized protein [Parasteatoda tepidariorum]|uniref:uncharacterized protein n=1 Tax=Parasteatoda tepidariorum TaxID=114398 RepID=UPI001C71B8C2|nr:uncharacterized protein LOC122272052 [Parasteatoda tepidariorum]
MVAWILRFCTNCRNPGSRRRGELSVDDINSAEQKLLKIVQQESFGDTVTKNKLKGFNTFRDADDLIRIKTKIFRREDEENFKYPIVLPSDHPLVEKLIYEKHLVSCHSGTQVVLSYLRQTFWVLGGRKTVQRILKRCIRCKRYSSKKLETVPASLPKDRVRDALVFEVTGVDLAGPLYLKNGDKVWILLFTCAVYRAIHLELIQSLSTDRFLLGLRRFIARRGRPRTIYSDNGTNFVGAVNLMASIDWSKIVQESSILRIQWVFSPPEAAWWGRFWERMVQMVKNLLRRVLGKASINFEELSTVLCDAEAVINSRPLNYLSEDPEDLTPLTPAMFLQDVQTVGVPDLDNLDSVNLAKRCRYQQKLREDLRKRFREEYLSMLIHRQENKKPIKRIQIGDVVLIECDKRRLDWPMGRVVEVFPGKDNSVRVVKLKTGKGELIRPVQRLHPLELDFTNEIFNREPFKQVKIKKTKDITKITKLNR